MATPFKMKGNPLQRNFGSALKKTGVNFNDSKVRANYEKYKDNPEYKKALAKSEGGKTTYNAKTNESTTEVKQ